jgi:glutathione S-transferase
MVNLPYQVRSAIPMKGPKGKLPFIEDKGKRIADSRFIIEYLQHSYGVDPDGHLSRQERAISNSMQRMIDDDLYWMSLYSRAVMPANWQAYKQALFHVVPPVMRDIVAIVVRRHLQNELYAQGMGRHTETEVFDLGKRVLTSLSDFLADKPFFMGEQPTILDATAYGFLINVLWCPIESPLKAYAKQMDNLVEFSGRMKSEFFAA